MPYSGETIVRPSHNRHRPSSGGPHDNNRTLLDALFAHQAIDFFDQTPAARPAPIPFDRVEGMILGLTIDDSLGIISESKLPDQRRSR